MSNQNQTTISTAIYNGDLSDAYSMAENDLGWMETALNHVRKEILKLKEKAKNGEHLSEYHFTELTVFLDMYSYLAEERCEQAAKLAKEYDAEFQQAVKEGNL